MTRCTEGDIGSITTFVSGNTGSRLPCRCWDEDAESAASAGHPCGSAAVNVKRLVPCSFGNGAERRFKRRGLGRILVPIRGFRYVVKLRSPDAGGVTGRAKIVRAGGLLCGRGLKLGVPSGGP